MVKRTVAFCLFRPNSSSVSAHKQNPVGVAALAVRRALLIFPLSHLKLLYLDTKCIYSLQVSYHNLIAVNLEF